MTNHAPNRPEFAKLALACVIVFVTALGVALHIQSVLGNPQLGISLLSNGLRERLARWIVEQASGTGHQTSFGPREPPFTFLFLRSAVVALGAWLGGAVLFRLITGTSLSTMLWQWGLRSLWLGLLGFFEVLWGVGGLLGTDLAAIWFSSISQLLLFIHTLAVGGFLASAITLLFCTDRTLGIRRALAHPALVWLAAGVYAATFSTLSILQYRALMVPHGDTAMYEEHLWNLLHGKAFRSQLDGGRLFLGEHLEVIHLLLLPVYVLFPSLPTLNVCLSLGLGAGAIAVRGITGKVTASAGTANWLALAYLLYFPLQYLNLETSLKTFRPENFGVPLMLFALWCLETNRFRTMLVLLGLALLAKEDYAIPVGMIGLFMAVRRGQSAQPKAARWLGLGIFVFAVLYLWFVLAVFIPHFRGGPPHYTVYFKELGDTPGEIVSNMARHPGLLLGRLCQYDNLIFLLLLALPLAALPLLGIGRIWLLVPSLVSILLIELDGARTPFFHFHAPLVPVLFWAATEGLGRLRIADRGSRIDQQATIGDQSSAISNQPSANTNSQSVPARRDNPQSRLTHVACLAAMCALVSGFWIGKSPLSLAFYDPSSDLRGFWGKLYSGGVRVQRFYGLFPIIPLDASVAATDYVRPRFTHHRECHQYGEGGLKSHVSVESVDYIVVDLMGPYSKWAQGHWLREVEENPDRWERVYDDFFYFLVVRAKRADRSQVQGTGPPGAAEE
ncbi:MAG: DUF2079 domain-containing protein [Planctomycetes bacterium]|nr:DUF2079 domain-containing protein [Planctomycetota bacterium]